MKRLILGAAAAFIGVGLAACSGMVANEHQDIEGYNWDKDDKRHFEIPLDATDKGYDIEAIVRMTKNYPHDYLQLHIEYSLPGGSPVSIEPTVIVRESDGKMNGSIAGDLVDVPIEIAKGVKLPTAGNLLVDISHIMPKPKIPLVMKVGVRVNQAK